jgi:hypothetical protein
MVEETRKPRNFSQIELCRACVIASMNPLVGTHQKLELFCRDIKTKFDKLVVTESKEERS